MIPQDREELNALAGEYVLGVLEPAAKREVEDALATNAALRSAVTFWEEQLHPLSALAVPADPPVELWKKIETGLDRTPQASPTRWWDRPAPWRLATSGLAAVAAALLLYIAIGSGPASPTYMAMLHSPQQQDQMSFVAMIGRDNLTIHTMAAGAPPAGRVYEVWAMAPGGSATQAIGMIPQSGILRVSSMPMAVKPGMMLAVSIEPPAGSPDPHKPSGPVMFMGEVQSL